MITRQVELFFTTVSLSVTDSGIKFLSLKMFANKSRLKVTHYGVLVCSDNEKLGGVLGVGKRYIHVFGNKEKSELEEWHIFSTIYGELPSKEDLDTFTGFYISGSARSSNEDSKWIEDLKTFIRTAAKHPSKPRVVGVCFGHQVIAAALGGSVTVNPSGKFVLQSEEIKIATQSECSRLHRVFKKLLEAGDSLRLLESHEDCVASLPPGAQTLASSATCQHEMIQFTENIFGIQAHPEFNVQDMVEALISSKLAAGKIDKAGQKFCEGTLTEPLDSAKVVAALKKFVAKDDD